MPGDAPTPRPTGAPDSRPRVDATPRADATDKSGTPTQPIRRALDDTSGAGTRANPNSGASGQSDVRDRRGQASGNDSQGGTVRERVAADSPRSGNGQDGQGDATGRLSVEQAVQQGRADEIVRALQNVSKAEVTAEQRQEIAYQRQFVERYLKAREQGQTVSDEDSLRYNALSNRLEAAFKSSEALPDGALRSLYDLTRQQSSADGAGQPAAERVSRPSEGEAGRAPAPQEQPLSAEEQVIVNDTILNLAQNWVAPNANHAEIVERAMDGAKRLVNDINNGNPSPQEVVAYRANHYAFERLLADPERRFEALRPVLAELDKLQNPLPNVSGPPTPQTMQGNDAVQQTDAGAARAEPTSAERQQAAIERMKVGIDEILNQTEPLTDGQKGAIKRLTEVASDLTGRSTSLSSAEAALYQAMRTTFREFFATRSGNHLDELKPIYDALHPGDNTAIPPPVVPIKDATPPPETPPSDAGTAPTDQPSAGGAPNDVQLKSALADAHVDGGARQAVEKEFHQLDEATQAVIMSLPSTDRAMIFRAIADGAITAEQIEDIVNGTTGPDNPFAGELQRWQEIEQHLTDEAKRALEQLSPAEQADRKLLMIHLDEEKHMQLEALRTSDPEAYKQAMEDIIARGEPAVATLKDELDARVTAGSIPVDAQLADMNAALAAQQAGQTNADGSSDPGNSSGSQRIGEKRDAADEAERQMAIQHENEKARKDAIFKILLAIQIALTPFSLAAGAA